MLVIIIIIINRNRIYTKTERKEIHFGINNTWMTPGMQVKVVNSYEATSLSVAVIKLRNVDYKTPEIRACLFLVQKIQYWH